MTRRKDKICLAILALAFAVLLWAVHAQAAPVVGASTTTGISQGWVIGTVARTVAAPVQGGSIRKQIIIQSDPTNTVGSYICVAFGSPSQGLSATATCSTAGNDNGGIKISPGGSMEWPRDPGGPSPVPQGDISIACTVSGCLVTVFTQ
jgi:hypothetical protein